LCPAVAASASFLDGHQLADFCHVSAPLRVDAVPAKHRLYVGASPTEDGFEQSHRFSSANDGDSLAAVLHGIEEVREVARGIRCADLSHQIRLSD